MGWGEDKVTGATHSMGREPGLAQLLDRDIFGSPGHWHTLWARLQHPVLQGWMAEWGLEGAWVPLRGPGLFLFCPPTSTLPSGTGNNCPCPRAQAQ